MLSEHALVILNFFFYVNFFFILWSTSNYSINTGIVEMCTYVFLTIYTWFVKYHWCYMYNKVSSVNTDFKKISSFCSIFLSCIKVTLVFTYNTLINRMRLCFKVLFMLHLVTFDDCLSHCLTKWNPPYREKLTINKIAMQQRPSCFRHFNGDMLRIISLKIISQYINNVCVYWIILWHRLFTYLNLK